MNLEVKDLRKKVVPMLAFVKQYIVFIFFIILLIIFGFLVLRINQYSSQEPSEDAITEKLETVQRPRIDKDALDKIKELEDQNLQVRSLIEEARDNPFNE